MIYYLLTAFIIFTALATVSCQLVTTQCLRAICTVATECNIRASCNDERCGPFLISRKYWADSELWRFTETYRKSNDFNNCASEYQCASETVRRYLDRNSQDCNGDGTIDCRDYQTIHFNGGCTKTMSVPDFVVILPRVNHSISSLIPRNVTTATSTREPASVDAESNSHSLLLIIGAPCITVVFLGLIVGIVLLWWRALYCFSRRSTFGMSVKFDPEPILLETKISNSSTSHQGRIQESYLEPIKMKSMKKELTKTENIQNHNFRSKEPSKKPGVKTKDEPVYENFMMAASNQEQSPSKHDYIEVLKDTPNFYSNVGVEEDTPAPDATRPDYDYVYDWNRPHKY